MFNGKQRIHFVGIGGSGMSGIAEVALNLGHQVSGSATGVAAKIEGTIVHEIASLEPDCDRIVLGHASGYTAVNVRMRGESAEKAGIVRTARRIMDGTVYIR